MQLVDFGRNELEKAAAGIGVHAIQTDVSRKADVDAASGISGGQLRDRRRGAGRRRALDVTAGFASQRRWGRVGIVAGARRGIGLAVAERFAAEGGRVCITARKQAALDEAVELLGGPHEDMRSERARQLWTRL